MIFIGLNLLFDTAIGLNRRLYKASTGQSDSWLRKRETIRLIKTDCAWSTRVNFIRQFYLSCPITKTGAENRHTEASHETGGASGIDNQDIPVVYGHFLNTRLV